MTRRRYPGRDDLGDWLRQERDAIVESNPSASSRSWGVDERPTLAEESE